MLAVTWLMMLYKIAEVTGNNVFQLVSENVDVVNSSKILKSETVSSITQCALMCSGSMKCDGFVVCEVVSGQQSFICKSVYYLDAVSQLKPSKSCSYYEGDYCGKELKRGLTEFIHSEIGISIVDQLWKRRMHILCRSLKETPLQKGLLVDTIPKISKSWIVSFDLKITGPRKSHYRNIIHFTIGENGGQSGTRIPAVWFNYDSFKLHFVSAVDNNTNYIRVASTDTQVDIPTNVLIMQYKDQASGEYIYVVYIDRIEFFKVVNHNAEEFSNVKVYTGDPWYEAANAAIQNLVYGNLE